jgi:hypothetical protein
MSDLLDQNKVAQRALCFGALLAREGLEESIRLKTLSRGESPSELAQRLNSWLAKEGISTYFSPREKDLVGRPLGSWTMEEIVTTSWRSEALGVVLWTLSSIERLPPYDTQFSKPQILASVGLGASAKGFAAKIRLRPQGDVSRERDVAELWHWRARTAELQRKGVSPPPGWTFQQVIAQSARQAYQNGLISKPLDEDFSLFGKSYRRLSEEESHEASSISLERHFALNWLCGHSENWDETSTET